MTTRRDFLKTLTAALPALTWSSGLYATPGNDARFLLVFLRGGYDAANLLIPHSSSFYYESRPNIAIARPNPTLDVTALPVDSDWGLHPALRDSLWPLFQRREVAFIPFAGTANTSRSHFETQDSIELGQPLEGRRDFNTGFLNRLVEVLGGRPAIAFTDNLPVVFKGAATIPNTALKNTGKAPFDERQSSLLASMYRNHPLEDFVREGLDLRREMAREFDQEMKEASRNAVSAKGFELEARRMARLMRDKFHIGFVDIGGWDSHINQGGTQGMLANNLDNLGRGLAAFAVEMQPNLGKNRGVGHFRIRQNISRKRQPRHRPRSRNDILGSRRRHQRRKGHRRANPGREKHVVPGSRFPGSKRLSERIGRTVREVICCLAQRLAKSFPFPAEQPSGNPLKPPENRLYTTQSRHLSGRKYFLYKNKIY